ncbi:MAG: MFS transporter [Candidatus Lokiarchaeota archaeon]|nr:MFS transporter [Candidatus Lokiarchaeota archaeon]MBD3341272.1 MFS transporter [Candidatus Lokiarchaeota archaeon]
MTDSNGNSEIDIPEKKYSTWTHISFNLIMVMLPATYGMYATHVFWYYETEVLLPVLFVGLAIVIFSIWDAFNDPLIGYLSDRPNKLTKKYGRRFPYIVIFGIPTMVTLILLFTPPQTDAQSNPWPVFIWLLVILLLHEVSYTAVSLARALFPEKFRSDAERRKNAGINIFTYNIGLFMGLIIPMLIVREGDLQSYWIAAITLMIPCFILYLLGIHGVKEDKQMRERALKAEHDPFFPMIKKALKRKNFVVLALVSISTQVFAACIMGSIYYYVKFILLLPVDSQADVILMLTWFLTGLLSVPFWMKLANKTGNKNLQMIGVLAVICACIPVFIVRSLMGAIISFAILGFTIGSLTFIKFPIFGDLIDEVTLIDEKRQEGLYQGVFVFLDRIGIILTPIIFTITHIVTDFNPQSETQTLVAQQGILMAMLGIPALIMLISALIFWKYFDLTPEKTLLIKGKLKEKNL